jgi:ribulose-5-phosphate 4-epimerase/fuculose-1-phosphate aldolase
VRVAANMYAGLETHSDIHYRASPELTEDLDRLRALRKFEVAMGYRIFAAQGWGQTGDGHITARDPILTDHFWILGYGIAFGAATVNNLALVSPECEVVDGPASCGINRAAFHIHWPVLDARPDIASAAHTHTPYGTPWCANVELFEPISQEACSFVYDQAIYEGEDVDVQTTEGGEAIAKAMGDNKLVFLRNHGLLTADTTPGGAVGWFVQAERAAETHIKASTSKPISEVAAKTAAEAMAEPTLGWRIFQWLARDLVPDPSVVL